MYVFLLLSLRPPMVQEPLQLRVVLVMMLVMVGRGVAKNTDISKKN